MVPVTKIISTAVHPDTHKKLKCHCAYNDLMMSEVVGNLILDYLKSIELKKKPGSKP